MVRKSFHLISIGLVGLGFLTAPGCFNVYGPSLGYLSIPIPVSPYFQDRLEDQFIEQERYQKVPILGPITAGAHPVAMDPPSDDQVMRALEKVRPVEGGIPFLHEVQRTNVRIKKELIADYMDPPRHYPLIGPAQVHHCHYKCTVYFTEITRVGWPIPYTTKKEDAQEVIYIDLNHFHIVGNVECGPTSGY